MALYRCGIIVLLLCLLHGTTALPVYKPATNPPSSLLDTRPGWGIAVSEVRLDGHQQYFNKGPSHQNIDNIHTPSSSFSSSGKITPQCPTCLARSLYGYFIMKKPAHHTKPTSSPSSQHEQEKEKETSKSLAEYTANYSQHKYQRLMAPAVILSVMMWLAVLAAGIVELVGFFWERCTEGGGKRIGDDEHVWDEVKIGFVTEGEEDGGEEDDKGCEGDLMSPIELNGERAL